jgi:formate dehydrogenase gamma subunit
MATIAHRLVFVACVFPWVGAPGPARAQGDAACLECHGAADLFEGHERAAGLHVEPGAYGQTLHAAVGLACVDCHQDLAGTADFPHAERLAAPRCTPCHDAVEATFATSVHGYAVERGNPRAPTCAGCHGAHAMLPAADAASPTHRAKISATCARCHGQAGLLTNEFVKLPQPFEAYQRSVHGDGEGGSGATCVDCHGVHDLRAGNDAASRIHRANVASTCGRCHADVAKEYEASIHGMALAAGIGDSPTCNDCHGEHLVLPAANPDSRTHGQRLASETCGTCHNNPNIIAKYRLTPGVVGSYVDSYHGWATRREYAASASCVSCHTAHAVLPEAHPDSTVHADRVLATCQQCHERATQRFAESYTHAALSVTTNPVNRWIRSLYIGMIVAVIGAMLLHNLVILNYYVMERRRQLEGAQWVRRLDRAQIVQHALLALSFVGLVVTGFALRFPEAWWVRGLSRLGMSEPVRSDLHRACAVLLVAAGLWHAGYMLLTRRGRGELRAIAPSRLDARQMLDNLRFHVWLRREHPEFGRYDYTQKAEYWALIWGTVVMAVTGIVLWFPVQMVRFLPAWAVTASQTIHYYEAWLATLAVLVWHFFFVVFHPEAYPMSWTWLTGKMSREAALRHHTQWYRDQLAARQAAAPQVGAPAAREPEA